MSNDEAERYLRNEGLNKLAEFLRDAPEKRIALICNYRFVKLKEEERKRERKNCTVSFSSSLSDKRNNAVVAAEGKIYDRRSA